MIWILLRLLGLLLLNADDSDAFSEPDRSSNSSNCSPQDSSASALSATAMLRRVSETTIGVRARGAGGLQPPPDSGKTIIFRAKAKFFGQKPAAKNEKNYIILCLLNEQKRNSFRLAR